MVEERIERALSDALADQAARAISPTADLWPKIAAALAARSARPRRRPAAWMVIMVGTAVALAIGLAGAALAKSSTSLPVVVRLGGSPSPHVGSLPRSSTHMSLSQAERAAGFRPLRVVGYSHATLVDVEYLSPVTQIEGRPVVNPQPDVQLVYRLGAVTATVQERRNTLSGQPLQAVLLSPTPQVRAEVVNGFQRLVQYDSDGRKVLSIVWATQDLDVSVVFEPGIDPQSAQSFVDHLE